MRREARGFTLLEIIVALAIAALGIAAVAKATGSAATVAGETRERMIAVWVAGNRLSELKLSRAWPAPGSHDVTRTMGGRTWYLDQVVSETDVESIRRVEIVVYTDPELSRREFSVAGSISRFEPDAELPEGPEGNEGPGSGDADTDEDDSELPDINTGVPLPGDEPVPEPEEDGDGQALQ